MEFGARGSIELITLAALLLLYELYAPASIKPLSSHSPRSGLAITLARVPRVATATIFHEEDSLALIIHSAEGIDGTIISSRGFPRDGDVGGKSSVPSRILIRTRVTSLPRLPAETASGRPSHDRSLDWSSSAARGAHETRRRSKSRGRVTRSCEYTCILDTEVAAGVRYSIALA